jgi:DnaK suppressor protein
MTVQNEIARKRLLQLRHELEEAAAANEQASAVVELDQSKVGRLSRMDAMQAQAMSLASGRRRELMLQRIEVALRRVDAEDYGYCQSCEEPIAEKRLEFDPTTLFCVNCAEKAEQQKV